VFVIRAFVKMREALRGTPHLARKLTALEKKLTDRLDIHEAAIVEVLQEIMQILNPPPEPQPPEKQIGFHPRTRRLTSALNLWRMRAFYLAYAVSDQKLSQPVTESNFAPQRKLTTGSHQTPTFRHQTSPTLSLRRQERRN
jgi:hypothetical protein